MARVSDREERKPGLPAARAAGGSTDPPSGYAHDSRDEGPRVYPPGTEPGYHAVPAGGGGGDGGPGLPPPAASFSYTPPSPGPNANVTFDGSGSAPGDPSAPVTRYDWVFDTRAQQPDGGPVVTWKMPGGHGSYTVTLTVTAQDGQSGVTSQTVSN